MVVVLADRVIELSKAFDEEDFDKFDRKRYPKVQLFTSVFDRRTHRHMLGDCASVHRTIPYHRGQQIYQQSMAEAACRELQINFAGMMEYDGELHIPKNFLVPPPNIKNTSGEFLAHNGISTFACSESQKIGHVTFFWNGNRGGPFNKDLEKHKEVQSCCNMHLQPCIHNLDVSEKFVHFGILAASRCTNISMPSPWFPHALQIKSDTGIPFNKKPEMKSKEIAEEGVKALKSGEYHQVSCSTCIPGAFGTGFGDRNQLLAVASAQQRATWLCAGRNTSLGTQ